MPDPKSDPKQPSATQQESLVLFGQDKSQLPIAVQRAIERYNLKTRDKAGVAPTWKPEKAGDYIVGEVLSVRPEMGQYKSTVVTIGAPSGNVAVWLGAELKLKLNGVKEGQIYCIVYDGVLTKKDNPKLKNDMRLFRVTEIMQ